MVESFAKYLHNDSGFTRFMHLWKAKYESLGKLGGSIVLNKAEESEKKSIGLLLGINFARKDNITINYNKFCNALKQTKYENIDFEEVLFCYFDYDIVTKKEVILENDLKNNKIINSIFRKYENTKVIEWLSNFKLNLFIKEFENDEQKIHFVLNAINELPIWFEETSSFSVFANKITKNSHYFDDGIQETLLLQAIAYFFNDNIVPATHILKNELWLKAGIQKENVLNYIMTCRLLVINKNKRKHKGLKHFFDNFESLNLNVENLYNIEKVIKIKKVIIIENPSVFSNLQEYIKKQKIMHIGLICTNGELNLAGYMILDIITRSNLEITYCGDFDPEGLLIAQRVNERCENKVKFLYYERKYYKKSVSENLISEARLKKLNKCYDQKLEIIKNELLKNKYSAYQEALIEEYIKTLA